MSKFILSIHNRVNFAIKKGLTGYISPDKIDTEVNTESYNLWRKYAALYERDADITAIMDQFRRQEAATLVSGEFTMTAAYQRPVGVVDSAGKKIEIVDIAHWPDRLNHPLKAPNTNYPACTFENKKIIVRPTTIKSAVIYYLKYPEKYVYAFSTVGSRYVYDDSTSADAEWPEIIHDDLMLRVLSNLGINMRELMVLQYSQAEKAQEGK